MAQTFDVVIIGGGPGGEHALGRAIKTGFSTSIVERELVGGECSYWACMPSKALLRPGRALAAARSVPGAREAVTGEIGIGAALARRNEMASNWDDAGQVEWVRSAGGTLVRGHGRLAGERRVLVETDSGSSVELVARRAVIVATGSAPAIPPIPGLAETAHWDNRQATSAQSPPTSLVVLGGGPVGVELAQAWKRLGSAEVAVVEAASRLLPSGEPFVSDILVGALRDDGVVVKLGAHVTAVRRQEGGPVELSLEDNTTLSADELLVATGRHPRTDDIGLESVGLEPGHPIETAPDLRATGVGGGWLFALGDVIGEAPLTHMAKYQARIAVRAINGEDVSAEADHRAVTGVVFTDPQVASVGLTEAQAGTRGLDVRTVVVEIASVSGASIEATEVAGAAQLVVDKGSETIVGATFVGPDVGELLHAATIAVVGRVPLGELRHAVAAFPTISEVWLELVESYFDSPSSS